MHEELLTMMKGHFADDDRRFKELGEGVNEIKEDIKSIKENHLAHIQTDMAKISTNLNWVMKFVIGAGSVVGVAIIGAILKLILK